MWYNSFYLIYRSHIYWILILYAYNYTEGNPKKVYKDAEVAHSLPAFGSILTGVNRT